MTGRIVIIILITSFSQLLYGQSETYTIKKAAFSTEKYDDFSPVYYNQGIVFCSNRTFGISSHTTAQNKGLLKIFYVDSTGKESPRLFSKNLTSILNDGPVSFNKRKDTVYFSRNQDVTSKLSSISSARNKLGIFSAVLINDEWTKVRELRINNEWYNITTPCISPDGKKLFFASDKPGGYGGLDLYYSLWKSDRWEDPVNLGPEINTKGNESYPFINSAGELFFSSDGRQGLGGKDIYFSVYEDSAWYAPVRLDAPINSAHDDFGIVTDPEMKEGYFSSNRDNSVDIYHFRTNSPQVLFDKVQKENQYCFILADSGTMVTDSTSLKSMWNFGDGKKATGPIVTHCFPGAGNYNVRLDLFDKNSNRLFFTKLIYEVEIHDFKQPFINSADAAIKGDQVHFDGLRSNLEGYKVLNYMWNFRDGSKASGETVNHIFKRAGDYLVNLQLSIKSNATGEVRKTGVSKKIRIFDDARKVNDYLKSMESLAKTDIGQSENARIKTLFSAEDEFNKVAVYNVELIASRAKIGVGNAMFRNVPKKYTITEKYLPEDSTYSYIVDQQLSLMATYPAYTELYSLGYKNVKIKTFVLKEPSEKELYNLIKINGAFADSYFDSSDRLTSNAFVMLDQIVKLMNKYPSIKLEVAVHTDNSVPEQAAIVLTQLRSQELVSYMVKRGINAKRLVATGFGSSKPIAPNTSDREMKLNRRIDFIIIN